MDLPLGWHTDIAVRRAGDSLVEVRRDHLLVRTPGNPEFHWGNFVLVTDATAVDDADRWVTTFEQEFPGAPHRAIGLVVEPHDDEAWHAHGLAVEHEDVLSTHARPEPAPLADGYEVRQLSSADDWAQSTVLEIDEFPDDEDFQRRAVRTRADMSDRGVAGWFGAFRAGRLAAQLGIVDCGDGIARYQAVLTGKEHRQRGLASHLIGTAAQWAAERGAHTWVIVADADSPASRLYQSRGFAPTARSAQAYRKPHA